MKRCLFSVSMVTSGVSKLPFVSVGASITSRRRIVGRSFFIGFMMVSIGNARCPLHNGHGAGRCAVGLDSDPDFLFSVSGENDIVGA